jgi:hypothetical protein
VNVRPTPPNRVRAAPRTPPATKRPCVAPKSPPWAEDRAAAETVAARLADVQREVAALAERRAALTKDHALPKNRLAYAMQREHLARTEVRITNELERLAAIEGVRDEIESALTPILDVFLTTAR